MAQVIVIDMPSQPSAIEHPPDQHDLDGMLDLRLGTTVEGML